jgi:hypothetical protein
MSLEVKVQLQDSSLEDTLEATLPAHLPLVVDNLEGHVFIGGARVESKHIFR